jgi:hypothetical protein
VRRCDACGGNLHACGFNLHGCGRRCHARGGCFEGRFLTGEGRGGIVAGGVFGNDALLGASVWASGLARLSNNRGLATE